MSARNRIVQLRLATHGAFLFAEEARERGDRPEARLWLRRHIKTHAEARALAKQAKAVKP